MKIAIFDSIQEAKLNASKIRTRKQLRVFAKNAISILKVKPNNNYKIIDSSLNHSCYFWDGTLGISQPQLNNIKIALKKFGSNQKLSDFDVYHIVELFHEELHGCCPLFYTANNKKIDNKYVLREDFSLIEETSVELLARLSTLYLDIQSEQNKIPIHKNGKWSYCNHIYLDYATEMADCISSITKLTKNDAMNSILSASISIREKRLTLYYMYQYIKLFGIHLGLNKSQISQFMKYYYNC